MSFKEACTLKLKYNNAWMILTLISEYVFKKLIFSRYSKTKPWPFLQFLTFGCEFFNIITDLRTSCTEKKLLKVREICLHFCSISVDDGRFIIQKRPVLTAAQLAKIVEIREMKRDGYVHIFFVVRSLHLCNSSFE